MTGKTFAFGRESRLIGMIVDPNSASACNVGVIAWGLGLTELRVVKRLSSMGFTSMQVGLQNEGGTPTRLIGVELCLESINELRKRHRLEKFVLFGTCARASQCLNTALIEPSVIGLILVNPHVSEKLSYWPMLKNRISSLRRWKNVFTGRTDFLVHLKRIFLIGFETVSKRSATKLHSRLVATDGDTTLPEDLDSALSALSARDVETIIICSEDDPSLFYFRETRGHDLSGLQQETGVSIQLLPAAPHSFNKDHDASLRLEKVISTWIHKAKIGEHPVVTKSSGNVMSS